MSSPSNDVAAGSDAVDSTVVSDLVFALLLFAMASTTFIVGEGWGSKAWFFPTIIATGMYVCGVLLGIHALLLRRRAAAASGPIDRSGASPPWGRVLDAAWFIGVFFAYVALLPITGYILTTSLFYLTVFVALGLGGSSWGRRVVLSVLGAALATAALVLLFEYGFGVPLPGS